MAIEEIVAHPDEPAPAAVVAALGLGVALFVGFSAVSYWFLYGRVLVARIVVLGPSALVGFEARSARTASDHDAAIAV